MTTDFDTYSASPQDDVLVHVRIVGTFAGSVSAQWIVRVVGVTLEAESKHRAELTVVVTDDREIQKLNLDYQGIDAPTDVLSFGGQAPEFVLAPEQSGYLGDVIISYPRAEAQALAGGHAIDAELALLVIHGVLHLLGHDHAQLQDRDLMWERQAYILRCLELADIQPAKYD